jgi:hypothetical protein
MSFDQYSETPASNYITGYFLTGMAPSSVKVAGSDIMADLASYHAAIHTTGGTATAYTLTQTRQFGSLVAGLVAVCIPNATNTGASTFAPDGLTAKNIYANGAALIAGMIVLNVPIYLKYDGTQWNLLNPQRSTGSFTLTLTGMTGSTTGTVVYAIDPSGKFAQITNPSITGTSNATTMTGTGVPSVLSANSNATIPYGVTDSGTSTLGGMVGVGTTTWTFDKVFGTTGGFTNSGTKGLPAFKTSWSLD